MPTRRHQHHAHRDTAREAGLRYVNSGEPGLQRRRRGRAFVYVDDAGRRVTDAAQLARIRSLAVPPAWTDVWICRDDRGHVQATGRDQRGRKQARYHTRWRAVRDAAKFDHLIEFAESLPRLRAVVRRDLRRKGLLRERVIAAVVRLLDQSFIRVGNEEYARHNGSYGATTLQKRHVAVRGSTLRLRFRGKSGAQREVELDEPRLARVVRRCQDLPGQDLFQFVDEDGEVRDLESGHVNEYLARVTGRDVRSKDFRTWAATVCAAVSLRATGPQDTKKARKSAVVEAVATAATRLGNTPAVCRKSYVHPAVLEGYLEGDLCQGLRPTRAREGLSADERAMLAFLKQQRQALQRAARRRGAA